MFAFLKILRDNLLAGPSEASPDAPEHTPQRFRGKAQHDAAKCILCGICRYVCAAGAIQVRETADGSGMEFFLWHNSCVFCGLCANHCPTQALTMTTDWHLAHRGEQRFQVREYNFVPYGQCSVCGARILPRPERIVEALGARTPEHILLCPTCKRRDLARHTLAAAASIPEKGDEHGRDFA